MRSEEQEERVKNKPKEDKRISYRVVNCKDLVMDE